jgi:hypothetical protein
VRGNGGILPLLSSWRRGSRGSVREIRAGARELQVPIFVWRGGSTMLVIVLVVLKI